MIIIDLLIIILILFIIIFVMDSIFVKLLKIKRSDEKFINEIHKKRIFQANIAYSILLVLLIIFTFMGLPTRELLAIVILAFPFISSLVDFFIYIKYDRESKQHILSISHIFLYIIFLIILFTTDLFGLLSS